MLLGVGLSLVLGLVAGAVAAGAPGSHPPDGALGPGVTGLGWGLRSLAGTRFAPALSLAGIAVAAAMLLDMVMLSGGIDKSFGELLLGRGYQIRITPKGTLPFDTEASLPDATSWCASLRCDPDDRDGRRGAGHGRCTAGRRTRWLPSSATAIEPEAQGTLPASRPERPRARRHHRRPAQRPAAALLAARRSATRVMLAGRLDPQIAAARRGPRGWPSAGWSSWLYDYRGQPSVGAVLPVMQRLARQPDERSRLARPGARRGRTARSSALVARLRASHPHVWR